MGGFINLSVSRGPCLDSPHHGDTGMDLTGTGDPKGSCLGVDNVEPDIVTSGGPPTLLPLTIRGEAPPTRKSTPLAATLSSYNICLPEHFNFLQG